MGFVAGDLLPIVYTVTSTTAMTWDDEEEELVVELLIGYDFHGVEDGVCRLPVLIGVGPAADSLPIV